VGFLQIDLLTGTLASRALILLVFALTVLSSIGLDQIIKYASQKKLKVIGSIASIYMAVLGSLFLVALLDWRLDWNFWFTPAQAFFALKSIAIPVLISSLTFILLGLVTINKKAISI